MENLTRIIEMVLRHVSPQQVLDGQIDGTAFSRELFVRIGEIYMKTQSATEIENMWAYYQKHFREHLLIDFSERKRRLSKSFDVFDCVFYLAKYVLDIRDNEVVCSYARLMEWRMLTYAVSEDVFVAAFYAMVKMPESMTASRLAWNNQLNHDNFQLNKMMKRGISENHFHLWGSMPIFQFNWVSLMNNVQSAVYVSHLNRYDERRRYTHVHYGKGYSEKPLVVQYRQAALIRLFLFSWLTHKEIKIGEYEISYQTGAQWLNLTNKDWECDALKRISVRELYNLFEKSEKDGEESQYFRGMTAGELFTKLLEPEEKRANEKEPSTIRDSAICRFLNEIFGRYIYEADDFFDYPYEFISLTELICLLWKIKKTVPLEPLRDFLPEDVYYTLWHDCTLHNVMKVLKHDVYLTEYLSDIQGNIAALGTPEIPDYALKNDYGDGDFNADDYIFIGERWIMYQMFREIWEFRVENQWIYNLFYAYLLLRENMRSELIQSNIQNVGFDNFQLYERRKTNLIDNFIWNQYAVRKTVKDCIEAGNLESLEMRMTPEADVYRNIQWLKYIEHQVDISVEEVLHNRQHDFEYYFVYHFIKQKDTGSLNEFFMECRHYKLREKNRKIAESILEMRELFPGDVRRIVGIDAASQEIGCRPEVFAPIFRALRHHTKYYKKLLEIKVLPQLRQTYHVGEDFLDIADGLRAVDEAIKFLNMGCGDRIGHGMALGIDPKEWYESKKYRIYLPKQDYLDNIVWMYHNLRKYNIQGMDVLNMHLQSEFSRVFDEVYGQYLSTEELSFFAHKSQDGSKMFADIQAGAFDIHTYYRAWRLRGDEPELYASGYYIPAEYRDFISEYRVNEKYSAIGNDRSNISVAYLYYSYHYNYNVRRAGAVHCEVVIPPFYIEGIRLIQEKMCEYIAKMGIAIEANPSSNYLIGTFKAFDRHPMLRFYTKGLVRYDGDVPESPQISLSINTDDKGVFSTSLENEYALMARSLTDLKKNDGSPVYRQDSILDWLDNIRINGNEQSYDSAEKNLYLRYHEKSK